MSKRSHDESVLEEAGKQGQQPAKKHTLDSDEEDEIDSKKYNLMDPEEIEGEEDGTIDKDGEIQITPFNMKEEMAEGHFDAEGNYYWKKEVEIRDAWLDNIDDAKQFGGSAENDDSDGSSDDQTETIEETEKCAMYEQMLQLLLPGESVAKALRRLGGNKGRHSASARWRQKRSGDAPAEDAAPDRDSIDQLTGLADRLLSSGNMEVYQLTREAIGHQLDKLRKPVVDRLQGATAEDALDMFGESVDQAAPSDAAVPAAGGPAAGAGAGQSVAVPDANGSAASIDSSANNSQQPTALDADAEVTWQFRWEDSDAAEVHGPHSSSEMQAWSDSGYFSDAVQVRKTGTDNFYPAKRIDFEIYM